MDKVRIVNVADVSEGEAFVQLPSIDGRAVSWSGHSGLPRNLIERKLRRPRLSRYRAAWNAISDAQSADFVISHLPRMTAAIERLAFLRSKRRPHLAFSFNFTDLPVGRDLRRMTAAFAAVEQFCVYSDYERELYPVVFNISPERFRKVMWGQSAPLADRSAAVPEEPFVVAIGGEGRDYAGIVSAARARPDVQWLVIARPSSAFEGAPANLGVRFNLPAPITWGIAERASAVVVPLLNDTTCCGHITIASTQLLGLPMIVTRSHAVREYVEGMAGTTVIEPRDPDLLAAAAAQATSNARELRRTSVSEVAAAEARYDRGHWVELIQDFARKHL